MTAAKNANEAMLEGARRWMKRNGFPETRSDCESMQRAALEFTDSRFPDSPARKILWQHKVEILQKLD
jgi:hypothetical protein